MRRFSLRFSIAIFTFIIGIFCASIWYFTDAFNGADNVYLSVGESENKTIFCPAEVLNQTSDENEDYAVYSAILADHKYETKVMVVNDYTAHGLIADATNLNQEIPNLNEETISGFQTANKEDKKLENNFTTNGRIIFLSEKEESKIFRKNQDGWARFYKKYPKARGIVTFSRVGFNQERTQALVSVSYSCGGLCGQGNFIFLQMKEGKWAVERSVMLWVS